MFHAWFYLLSYVLFQLWSIFHTLSWTNLLTKSHSASCLFSAVFCSRKWENKYSRNWTGQKENSIFYRGEHGARRWDREGPRVVARWLFLLLCATMFRSYELRSWSRSSICNSACCVCRDPMDIEMPFQIDYWLLILSCLCYLWSCMLSVVSSYLGQLDASNYKS